MRLSHYINNDLGYSWASAETIAASCKVSTEVVRRTLRKLEGLGLIRTEHRPGTSSRHWLVSTEVSTEVEAPPAVQTAPPTVARGDETMEITKSPPLPPLPGGIVKPTGKTPAPPAPARKATPVFPRRRRRQVEPPVFAGCHAPAPAEYLQPQPRAPRPTGAIEALRMAASRAGRQA